MSVCGSLRAATSVAKLSAGLLACRHFHNSPKNIKARAYQISISRDATCYVALHPDMEHGYEYTRPMPATASQKDGVLKVDTKNMFLRHPNLEQVQQLTYTPKSRWIRSVSRAKRMAYKHYFNDNVDRSGLTS